MLNIVESTSLNGELQQRRIFKMDKKQIQQLDYLIEKFKIDSDDYKNLETPSDIEGKQYLLRSLMNIRMPKEMSEEILKIQDDYLKNRTQEKGIVYLSEIPTIRDGLSIWQGDITRLAVDAIVNAANSQMLGCFIPMHNFIYNCIHYLTSSTNTVLFEVLNFTEKGSSCFSLLDRSSGIFSFNNSLFPFTEKTVYPSKVSTCNVRRFSP